MPWDIDDRKFRQVEKTLADVSAQPTEAHPADHDTRSLDLDVTAPGTPLPPDTGAGASLAEPGFDDTRLASSTPRKFRVVERLFGKAAPLGGLSLIPAAPHAAEAYSIVTGDVLRIGRSKSEVDLVTWFLPRSTRNDVLTKRISRVHARLAVEDGRIWLTDCGTANGTTLDASPVTERVALPTSTHSELTLAGEYKLVIDPQPIAFPGIEVDGLPPKAPGAPCGAIRFHSLDKMEPQFRTVWLLDQISFGRGRGCGLRFQDTSLGDLQGVLCQFEGAVWIGVIGGDPAVWLDGEPLDRGLLAPIRGYSTLKIGRAGYSVTELQVA